MKRLIAETQWDSFENYKKEIEEYFANKNIEDISFDIPTEWEKDSDIPTFTKTLTIVDDDGTINKNYFIDNMSLAYDSNNYEIFINCENEGAAIYENRIEYAEGLNKSTISELQKMLTDLNDIQDYYYN